MRAKDWFYGALLLSVAGCVSCTMGGKKDEAGLVEDLAKNCKQGGMSEADINHEKDGDIHIHVGCLRHGI